MDRQKFFNNLSGLVKALEGKYTIIDLRNESSVTGKIIKVDGRMNVEMEDVVYYDTRGNEHFFESFYVSDRNVRYVHIPKKYTAVNLIETQKEKMISEKRRPKASRTFKTVRAQRYNKEITQAAYSQEKENAEEDKSK